MVGLESLSVKTKKRKEYFRRGRDTSKVDVFSEGPSDSEFPVKIKSLKKNRQIQRIIFLWRKTYSRASVSVQLIQATHKLHQNMMKMGSTKNLYGSKQHIDDMRELKKKHCCVLMPNEKLKTAWTLVIVVLLIYTAIFVPYKIAFIEEETTFLQAMEATVDILFGIDMFVNFISAIEDPVSGKLVVHHRTIAKHYLKGWFWLDFLACFPFQLIKFDGGEDVAGNQAILRLARLPRLYRLVRLLRMIKMLRVLKNSRLITDVIEVLQVNPAVTRLTKILASVFYMVHITACLWFFVANFEKKENNWADQKGLYTEPPMFQYLVAVYWAFQTVTTVGFGDIGIAYLEEYILSIMWMLFGVSVYTLTIGNVSSIIASIDSKAFFLSQKL